jgi:hypothetical protein
MYVYIAKFVHRRGLIKIGFSDDPWNRVKLLENHHGRSEVVTTFYAGYKQKYVELRTHKAFDSFRRKVEGAGGSEFFCESILDGVTTYIRTTHLPLELEPFLRDEQNQLDRCMAFSRRLLGKMHSKSVVGNGTFNNQKHRISLGVQILVEHGMGIKEAYACYASVLNSGMCKRLTGWRLRVALNCDHWVHWDDSERYTAKYSAAMKRRELAEVEYKTEGRKY